MKTNLKRWLLVSMSVTVIAIMGAVILMSAGKAAERKAKEEATAHAATEAIKKIPVNWQCFEFTPASATTGNVLIPGNYEPTIDQGPCGVPQTLCKICFDTDEFPLVNGLPDFSGEENELRDLVETYGLNTSVDGNEIETPRSHMQFYFRLQ